MNRLGRFRRSSFIAGVLLLLPVGLLLGQECQLSFYPDRIDVRFPTRSVDHHSLVVGGVTRFLDESDRSASPSGAAKGTLVTILANDTMRAEVAEHLIRALFENFVLSFDGGGCVSLNREWYEERHLTDKEVEWLWTRLWLRIASIKAAESGFDSGSATSGTSSDSGYRLYEELTSAYAGSPRLNESEARAQIRRAHVLVKDDDSIDLQGIRQATIDEVERLRNDYQANRQRRDPEIDIVITGGTEPGHMRMKYSHENGYKLDIRKNGLLDKFIQSKYENIGKRGDGVPLYRAPTGALYADEGNHWDVVIQ
jgi:hypothetical protein